MSYHGDRGGGLRYETFMESVDSVIHAFDINGKPRNEDNALICSLVVYI